MAKRLLWLPLLLVFCGAQAQLPFTLKIAPLELINPVQSAIFVMTDIPVARHWAVELGYGQVYASGYLGNQKGESIGGFRAKTLLKYYFSPSDTDKLYCGLEAKYRNIEVSDFAQIIRQGGQYTEWVLRETKYETRGLGIRGGQQIYFGKKKHLIFEPHLAIGWRQMKVTGGELPADAEEVLPRVLINIRRTPGTYSLADFGFGFYFGWAF